MNITNKKIDPLPDEFSSEKLEPVDFKADIKRRHFQVELDEESFCFAILFQKTAKTSQTTNYSLFGKINFRCHFEEQSDEKSINRT